MIPIVVAVEKLSGHGEVSVARARRVEVLGERVDDLAVLAAHGTVPEGASVAVEVLGRGGSFRKALSTLEAARGAGVVVVDGDLGLLERVSRAARSCGHRVLWSLDAEPSGATAERAGDLADGALVASSAWFPRRVGMRCWVVHARDRPWGDTGAPSGTAVQPWPPDPVAWADRVVHGAQALAQAVPMPSTRAPTTAAGLRPVAWTAATAATAAAVTPPTDAGAATLPIETGAVKSSEFTKFDKHHRGRFVVIALLALVVVIGLAVAATAELWPGHDGSSKRRDTVGVDSGAPGGSGNAGDRSSPAGEDPAGGPDTPSGSGAGSDDGRRSTSTTRPRSGGGAVATDSSSGSGTSPTSPRTNPATTPGTTPQPTQPTTPPTTTPPPTTPPPTTSPPPPPTTAPPPPPTTAPPPPTTAPRPPVSIPFTAPRPK